MQIIVFGRANLKNWPSGDLKKKKSALWVFGIGYLFFGAWFKSINFPACVLDRTHSNDLMAGGRGTGQVYEKE